MDADGVLEPQTLDEVAAIFADPGVGGVQVGVTIANAHERLMLRCQDIEFVGFSHLAQAARDRIGSVGLGGNGQFTRLSAPLSLGRPPWTRLPDGRPRPRPLAHPGRLAPPFLSHDLGRATGGGLAPRLVASAGAVGSGPLSVLDALPGPRLTQARLSPALICRLPALRHLRVFVTANLVITAAGAPAWSGWRTTSCVPAGGTPENMARSARLGPVAIFLVRYHRASRLTLSWWELPRSAHASPSMRTSGRSRLSGHGSAAPGHGGWAKTARVTEAAAS